MSLNWSRKILSDLHIQQSEFEMNKGEMWTIFLVEIGVWHSLHNNTLLPLLNSQVKHKLDPFLPILLLLSAPTSIAAHV